MSALQQRRRRRAVSPPLSSSLVFTFLERVPAPAGSVRHSRSPSEAYSTPRRRLSVRPTLSDGGRAITGACFVSLTDLDRSSQREARPSLYPPQPAVAVIAAPKADSNVIPSQLSVTEKPSPGQAASPEEEEDVISRCIGEYGRWQLLMTFLLSLFSFPCTFHIYSPTFTAASTDFWCSRPDHLSNISVALWRNYSQPQGSCSILNVNWSEVTAQDIFTDNRPVTDDLVECTKWDWDKSEVGETIVSEWGLVCDRAGLTNIAEVVFLVGVGVGGVFGGLVSDKLGRKRVLMTMCLVQSVLAILIAFSNSFIMYMLMKIMLGLCSVTVVYSAFVLSVELVGGKWVTIAGVCNFFPLPLSYVIVSALSLVLPDWRQLQLALSLPGCALLALWWYLPESPKWLLAMGRTKEVMDILQRAAKFNKRELPPATDKLLLPKKQEAQDSDSRIRLLFRKPLLMRTFCLSLAWFSMTIAYYGLVLNIGKLGIGNLHFTSIILGVVEIPAIALSIPILLKAGRRIPVVVTLAICGMACLCSEVVELSFDRKWMMIIALMCGKFAISATNIMMPTYTAELYPTMIRNLGVGGSQVSAGFGLICIPYLWDLASIMDQLPMITLAVLSMLGAGVILFLPDTGCREVKSKDGPHSRSIEAPSCNGTFASAADRGE